MHFAPGFPVSLLSTWLRYAPAWDQQWQDAVGVAREEESLLGLRKLPACSPVIKKGPFGFYKRESSLGKIRRSSSLSSVFEHPGLTQSARGTEAADFSCGRADAPLGPRGRNDK